MKIHYLTALEYPSPLANRAQVIKMSEAFAKNADIVLHVAVLHDTKENVFQLYGVTHKFEIKEVGRIASHLWPKSYWLARLYARTLEKEPIPPVLYLRDVLLAFFLTTVSKKFCNSYFIEIHSLEKFPKLIYKRVLQEALGIISTNSAKKEFMVESLEVPAEKILVAPNGFDARLFTNAPDRAQARKELGFGENEKIVLYAGSMQDWKGVGMLFQLARALPAIKFVIVGASHDGQKNGVDLIRSQPYWRVPLFLKAADLLIAPYRGDDARVQLYFSPIKIFEYMASGTPMIASDIPAIREIVDEKCVLFAKMGNRDSFAEKIAWAFGHEIEMEERAAAAKKRADDFSWEARALRIEEFIKHMS